MNRLILLTLCLCGLAIASCEDDFKDCGVDDPVRDLPWLIERTTAINDMDSFSEYMYFTQGEYKGRSVYLEKNCCPYCSTVVPVFSCSGAMLGYLGDSKEGIDPDDIKRESVIWKSDTNVCSI